VTEAALVIACNSAIGRAVCDSLGDRGLKVIGTTRSGELKIPNASRSEFELAACDVTDIDSIRRCLSAVAAHRPRHLIYCAGFHRLAPVAPASSGSLDEHMAVNFRGAVDCARLFVSNKFSGGPGQRSITIVASIAHRIGEAGLVGYSASKAAVVAAVRGMAVEYAPRNVRVNSVSPGWIEGERADAVSDKLSENAVTEIRRRYPLGLGLPRDVASAVSFLASDAARWITGTDLVVDGGRSCT
jgi:NAD(P)-dependent dehydrogenase (short-subunit alcohol dehydrogenase family)